MTNICIQLERKKILFFCVIAFMLFLSSCRSIKRQDGPPNFYVDETRIPNAVPKPEPLAKYGNMSVYRVFGKKYYTLRSSRNYQEIGTASWYGTLFHARKTSSGEPYNMLAMTAAHKTLPLPTYVEVTNLSNHKKIIVKVNDRGPFESNRIIDLSYVAAKKLGMLGHGTAKVKIKAIDPYTYGNPAQFAYRHERTWQTFRPQMNHRPTPSMYLQVGAFKNRANAEQLKRRLMGMLKIPATLIYPTAQHRLYRIKIGPLRDVATARSLTTRLRDLGLSSNRVFEA